MQESSSVERRKLAVHPLSRWFWAVLLVCVIALVLGMLYLPAHARAAVATPGKPSSISATPGNQQVALSWGAASGATGYLINETDLVTGTTTQLSTTVTTTSFTVTGLLVGHWYRFSVVPVDDTGQGPSSDPIEVRTTGFSGSYQHYYALGDSYSAGEGAPPYTGPTGCYQSTNGYPYLLGSGVPAPVLLACSGARTTDIDGTSGQLSKVPKNPQGNTLITITIGGNDMGFSDEVEKCILSFSSCTHDDSTLTQQIEAFQPRLLQLYQEIRAVAPGADIIIVGYPLLFADPSIADCHNPIVYWGLSGAEMQMIRNLATLLDNTIAAAASQAGVFSVTQQVEQAFAGHEACTANESQEWINEIAGTNDALHDSFHPNSAGYHAYATAIDSARNLLYQKGMVRS
ncbi:MAG TPA: GDSL-type esterase/lipase family protein [Ktedonobacteraceae bacterium]|jgi:lysophospholipase L1-like esterase|nr:GDSL-type esterase/lipase family protein [Ktedonobacteraceae bacterium]